jgi:dolichol-phosphate mannosyltransferase
MNKETKNIILAKSSSVKVPRFIIVSHGIQQKLLDYTPIKRETGKSRYNLRSMFRLAGYAVLGSSSRLLRFGLLSALVYSIFIIILFIYIISLVVTAKFTAGWVSLMGTILFSFMLNFVLLGILGAYFAEYLSSLSKHTSRIKEFN